MTASSPSTSSAGTLPPMKPQRRKPSTPRPHRRRGTVEQHLAEKHHAAQQITDLEQLDVDSRTFTSRFATLKFAVTAHANREETDEFPALADLVDAQTPIRIHHIVRQVETFAALTDSDQVRPPDRASPTAIPRHRRRRSALNAKSQASTRHRSGMRSPGTVQLSMVVPFPMTVIPDAVTVWAARSAAGSIPMVAPGGTTTFWSRMAFRTCALRPIRTPENSTLPSTPTSLDVDVVGDHRSVGRGAGNDRPRADHAMQRHPFSTNFAGGRVSRSRMVVLRCYERQPVSGHNVDSRLSAGREVARLQPVGESRSSEGATVVVCRPGVGLCRAAALG